MRREEESLNHNSESHKLSVACCNVLLNLVISHIKQVVILWQSQIIANGHPTPSPTTDCRIFFNMVAFTF